MKILMTKKQIESLIRDTKNEFITVVFSKKNGDLRKLNGILGVSTDVKGTGTPMSKEANKTVVRIYDLKKKGWRSIFLPGVKSVKMRKKTYVALGES